jgi:uncharacterized protein YodC (DUF2158 family)
MVIRIGSIVKLNSGGPEMTIIRQHSDSDNHILYECMWFDDSKSVGNSR